MSTSFIIRRDSSRPYRCRLSPFETSELTRPSRPSHECSLRNMEWRQRTVTSWTARRHTMKFAILPDEISADLIVMPTDGYKGISHSLFAGSTAERVVQHSPCPVLVARDSGRGLRARILSNGTGPQHQHHSRARSTSRKRHSRPSSARSEFAELVVARLIVFTRGRIGPGTFTADSYGTYDVSPSLQEAARKVAEAQLHSFSDSPSSGECLSRLRLKSLERAVLRDLRLCRTT